MRISPWHSGIWQEGTLQDKKKIVCPYCGYSMPVYYGKGAYAKGVFVKCKGRKCKKTFEIKISVK